MKCFGATPEKPPKMGPQNSIFWTVQSRAKLFLHSVETYETNILTKFGDAIPKKPPKIKFLNDSS